MTEDFPAAHSMDTCWFGVDAKGRLAVFDTGEGGAVPITARPGDYWIGAFEHLPLDENGCRAIPIDGAPLAALCPPEKLRAHIALHQVNEFDPKAPHDRADSVALLCADLPAVAKRMIAGRAHDMDHEPYLFRHDPALIFVSNGKIKDLEALADQGALLGVSPPAPAFKKHKNDYAAYDWYLPYLGLYRFSCEEQFATPYHKDVTPTAAFAPSGGAAAAPHFVALPEIDFDGTAAFQPVPMVDCVAWGGTWWSVDGAAHNVGAEGGDLSDQARAEGDPERLRLAVLPEGSAPPSYDLSVLFDGE